MTAAMATAVLIELFTSEGCSSCPPADALLERLQRDQPVAGVELIVLSEHVDYWNDLGWKDPFSAASFSERQAAYGRRTYTPQAVIDGAADVVGSDREAILYAVKAAAHQPHGNVRIARVPDGTVRIAVSGLSGRSDADVMLAVVEDGLVSRVEKGENAGRTLRHTAVTRSLASVGRVAAGAADWTGQVSVPSDISWKQPRLVAFVQERRTRRILAAAALQEERDRAAAERDQRAADDQAHGAKNAHAP